MLSNFYSTVTKTEHFKLFRHVIIWSFINWEYKEVEDVLWRRKKKKIRITVAPFYPFTHAPFVLWNKFFHFSFQPRFMPLFSRAGRGRKIYLHRLHFCMRECWDVRLFHYEWVYDGVFWEYEWTYTVTYIMLLSISCQLDTAFIEIEYYTPNIRTTNIPYI